MGKMFFSIFATFAEIDSDLIRMRTCEGMAIARAKGKLRGRRPTLADRQAGERRRLYDSGDYSVSDLAAVFSVSRPTVYRTLQRQPAATWRHVDCWFVVPTGDFASMGEGAVLEVVEDDGISEGRGHDVNSRRQGPACLLHANGGAIPSLRSRCRNTGHSVKRHDIEDKVSRFLTRARDKRAFRGVAGYARQDYLAGGRRTSSNVATRVGCSS